MIRHLFKHSGIFFFGSMLSKVITTLAWVLLARVLSPEKYGQFTLYIMILQFATFFADFGLNQYYLKYIDEFGAKILFNKILFVRTVTLLISLVLIVTILFLFKIFDPVISLILILNMIPHAYLSIIDGYFLEQKKGLRVSLRMTSVGVFFLIGYLFLLNRLDLFNSSLLLFFSFLITWIIFFPWRVIEIKFLTIEETTSILKKSSSYAYLTLTSFFYNKGDSFIISYLKGDYALGIYGLAYRILESLSLLPSSLIQNLFPVSAKKEGISFKQLKKISFIMIIFGLIFSIVIFLSADYLIMDLFSKTYIQSIPILKIFALVILLFFINAPLATVVQSSNLVKSFLPYGIGNTIFNIFLNLIFIPLYGLHAAAWIMVFTEMSGLLINLYFVNKLYSSKTSIN